MYALNIDKSTGRVLSVGILGDGVRMAGAVCLETLPDIKNFSDYCYVDGELVYSPRQEAAAESASPVAVQAAVAESPVEDVSMEERVLELEREVAQLKKILKIEKEGA